jgi:hypothetical protein
MLAYEDTDADPGHIEPIEKGLDGAVNDARGLGRFGAPTPAGPSKEVLIFENTLGDRGDDRIVAALDD